MEIYIAIGNHLSNYLASETRTALIFNITVFLSDDVMNKTIFKMLPF